MAPARTAWLVALIVCPSGASLALVRARGSVRPVWRMSAAPPSGEDRALSLDAAVRTAMSSLAAAFAQREEGEAELGAEFSADVRVSGLLWSASSRREWQRAVSDSGKFLVDPMLEVLSVSVTGASSARVEWLASGTWPLPWRPRALALGSSALELETLPTGAVHVVRVTDTLQTSPVDVLVSQLLPNWEDVYSLYNSPPAELRPYRVVRAARTYELRWMPPGIALRCALRSATYPSSATHKLVAPLLPGFAFTGKPLNNRAVWSAVRPITVEYDQSDRKAGGPCAYRWTVPLPSRLGTDRSALPPLPPVESGVEEMEYIALPARYVAARRLAGALESDGAVLAEAEQLAAQLRADGVRTVDGTPSRAAFQFCQYNFKAGFNLAGQLAIAQYQGTAQPLRRNEILVDIEEPR
ncbi:hypothetical protein KFE25_008791 [Diacronema lutheri]|mgnify:CR=1 FL=1|uniref:Uncharacterized protein n=1 Tax=Diacronema lutheri TaxID=2081491 RepID=A0A8J5XYQ7_DIALT|nr:hypothetical protein KFE25_008791 [Diacronema lutheri]